MNPIHIMVDIETFGTEPGSIIASIGAVVFLSSGVLDDPLFYVRIDIEDAERAGLKFGAGTVKWWLKQSDAARAEVREGIESAGIAALRDTLLAFARYLNDLRDLADGELRLWAHGATFDPVLLDAAYRIIEVETPFKYHEVRDTRTIYELAGVKPDRSKGTAHNALDDARAQAEAVVECWRRIYLSKDNDPPEADAPDLRVVERGPERRVAAISFPELDRRIAEDRRNRPLVADGAKTFPCRRLAIFSRRDGIERRQLPGSGLDRRLSKRRKDEPRRKSQL